MALAVVVVGIGFGEMFGAARDDDELAGSDNNFALGHGGSCFVKVRSARMLRVAYPHAQRAFHDEKEFVLIFMVVPDEIALELDDFDVGVIQLADDARIAVIRK